MTVTAPFAGMTGRGIRIAVIDSGVNSRHPHIGRVWGGVQVALDGEADYAPAAWLDRLGHGTAVTAAIQEKAPDADIVAVKVFHTTLRTSVDALISAIDWCVSHQMDIINLSLGAGGSAASASLEQAAARAAGAGVVLVSARTGDDGAPCQPGMSPGVFGVDLDWDCPRETCRWDAAPAPSLGRFLTAGYPRPVDGVPPERNLKGVSFAVANVTGILACALEALKDLPAGPARPAALAAAMAQALAGQTLAGGAGAAGR